MIPKYDEIMLPLLRFAEDSKEHSKQDAVQAMRKHFSVSDEEFRVPLPSGRQSLFDNRVAWAKSYLKQAGLIESTRRGHFLITNRGKEVLNRNLSTLDKNSLMEFPEFVAFIHGSKSEEQPPKQSMLEPALQSQTPEEIFERAYQDLTNGLAEDLLDAVRTCSPEFFEKMVVELFVKMGYGGSLKDAGQAVGRSGDEGVDGIIKQDVLGLDTVYIQAKLWQGPVGRPEVQKFVGALQGKRAKKGIFITSSDFSSDAYEFVRHIDYKVILINGKKMAELMIEHGVGVSTIETYDIKKIDADYFTE